MILRVFIVWLKASKKENSLIVYGTYFRVDLSLNSGPPLRSRVFAGGRFLQTFESEEKKQYLVLFRIQRVCPRRSGGKAVCRVWFLKTSVETLLHQQPPSHLQKYANWKDEQ